MLITHMDKDIDDSPIYKFLKIWICRSCITYLVKRQEPSRNTHTQTRSLVDQWHFPATRWATAALMTIFFWVLWQQPPELLTVIDHYIECPEFWKSDNSEERTNVHMWQRQEEAETLCVLAEAIQCSPLAGGVHELECVNLSPVVPNS